MTDNSVTKTCTKCGLNLPASEFSKNKSKRDGLKSQCKGCCRAYYKANREQLAARKKVYNAANRKRNAEYQKVYREANHEKVAEYRKIYNEANREEIAEYGKIYNEANREQVAARKKAYFKANPDLFRAYKQNRRALKRNAEGTHTSEQVQARFAVHGNACIYCGSPDKLHIEHIKPLSKSGPNWPSNLAPACARCNVSKKDKWGKALLRWLEQNCTVARTSRILTAILT